MMSEGDGENQKDNLLINRDMLNEKKMEGSRKKKDKREFII